ncbi:GAF domain-containing protein [Streptomyces sp. NPDC002870]|uniref:GAF domain-containing protein n=1 Tax=Streptomyces sp. NPDC002870 TaxID=3364666 RepID=UPI0036CF6C78
MVAFRPHQLVSPSTPLSAARRGGRRQRAGPWPGASCRSGRGPGSSGCGLGGQVMLRRRPLWVSDYRSSDTITHHFKAQAETEGLGAMIAVPVIHEGRLFGFLYGANRETAPFSDRTAQALEQAASQAAAAAVVVAERARHAAEVAVQEEGRRLALELHDTMGAMLFSLGAGIRTAGPSRSAPGSSPASSSSPRCRFSRRPRSRHCQVF